MQLFTIGFTKRSAEEFFEPLRGAGVRRVVDVRLNNVSQLAGFTKRDDLGYFLDRVIGAGYAHVPLLAPTQELIDAYRKTGIPVAEFRKHFLALMKQRHVESAPEAALADGDCLLCSEPDASQCHRGFVVDYLAPYLSDLTVQHL